MLYEYIQIIFVYIDIQIDRQIVKRKVCICIYIYIPSPNTSFVLIYINIYLYVYCSFFLYFLLQTCIYLINNVSPNGMSMQTSKEAQLTNNDNLLFPKLEAIKVFERVFHQFRQKLRKNGINHLFNFIHFCNKWNL